MLKFLIVLVFFSGLAFGAPFDDVRVVNGTDADIEDYPFMVSVRGATGRHSCGGSMISPNWVLTAAHCIQQDPSYYSVQYSSTHIAEDASYVVNIIRKFVHEGYAPNLQYINDIGVLQTAYPIIVAQYSHLPLQFSDTMSDSTGTLIGWGLDQTNGEIQQTLQRVDLRVYSDFECASIHYADVYASNICAGVYGGGMGQCSGDSGGPLLVYGTQVGLVSWSVKPCTVPPYPGVYTQVSYYREWIRQRTGV